MKKSIIALGIMAVSSLGFMSCEDMLTVDTGDKAYINANDTLYSYVGILRAMQDVAERQVILGEIRGDLVASTEYTTDTLYAISNFDAPKDQSCSMLQVSDYYSVINNCNFYIHNCDTSAVKSNIKYMVPEYAQVKAIRAWAYLQLVKNYGAVPYITEPINNLSVVKNFDYKNNLVNKDNLVDRLIEDGLDKLVETRYPGFSTWDNGYTGISAHLCYIPIRVLLGDLYLLRGNSQSDYEQAAQYYYDYLKNETTPLPATYMRVSTFYLATSEVKCSPYNNYGRWASTYTYNANTSDVISLIPSSANAGLGKMLTRVADIFGYTPSSSQSSSETVGEDNASTGVYESSGAISVTPTYKRQYEPSDAYYDVVNDQTAIYYRSSGNNATPTPLKNLDFRFYAAVDNYSYDGETYPLCSKAAADRAFFYTIPIYRKGLIWLRLAEAINRAGYPEYAFAILKDGLNQYNLPTIGKHYEYDPIRDEHGYLIYNNTRDGMTVYCDDSGEEPIFYYYDADGQWTVYTDKVTGNRWELKCDTIVSDAILPAGSHQAMYYVTDIEQVRKFTQWLDFTDDIWDATYGIHARGAGFTSANSSPDFYITAITGRIDPNMTYDYYDELKRHGVESVEEASKGDIINAVENIIVDELALECAFEGNRFTDLVRIAEHKNAAGQNGTEWLAHKIANRGSRKATSKTPAVEAFDNTIYTKLKNTANWYLPLPAWSAK